MSTRIKRPLKAPASRRGMQEERATEPTSLANVYFHRLPCLSNFCFQPPPPAMVPKLCPRAPPRSRRKTRLPQAVTASSESCGRPVGSQGPGRVLLHKCSPVLQAKYVPVPPTPHRQYRHGCSTTKSGAREVELPSC